MDADTNPGSPAERRHLLIELARRRARPGTGSSEEFMQARTASQQWPDLRDVLQGVEWVTVGAVATRVYMPERVTGDLDIMVRERDRDLVTEKLKSAGYENRGELTIGGLEFRSPEGIEVDVIFGRHPWLDDALSKPQLDPAGYPAMAMPYLVLLKLAASRARDVGDLATMLGWADDSALAEVRRVVARFRPEDAEDLESLIYLGKLERQSAR